MDDLDLAMDLLTNPEVMRYVASVCSKDEVLENLPKETRRCAGGCIGIWCLVEKVPKRKIGTTVLLPLPVEEDDTNWDLVTGEMVPDCEIEVGYLLKKSAWGRGFASEACRRMLQFAFEESPLTEVVAVTDPRNTASRRVLEKCGMHYEGMRRAYREDCPGYRLTRQQWLSANGKFS